jgi:hypothetical protein
VLYLAPTNALVGQIRRHMADVFGASAVREFFGGAEYTQLAGEAIADVDDRQILVMTPEKCSLALRQNPEAFDRLALCILDEAHLLGDRGRGVVAELVLAEVMHRAPRARLLLMSALLANPDDLAAWLQNATESSAIVVDVPWRPTRTLRAIAGVDRERGEPAAADAYDRLSQRGQHRKNERFEAPVALLAGLQGAWRSDAAVDYSLVRTDIQFPLSVNREGKANAEGYCTPATMAVVQRLGERGDRVLAFLPRSKHDSFLAAKRMTGFGTARPLGKAVDALLLLADLELGVPSALRTVLSKRIAVHTSALLREEQRASEVAFDADVAIAMFATGTMAQGLNLPATAVVIGGTDIGYDDQANEQQKKDRARAQLLNAIGRAGRALVAPRSMAVVVPNKIVILDSAQDAVQAVQRAEFLKDEDASSAISSMLDGLITDAMTGNLTVEAMSRSEQIAFSFLSFAGGNQADTSGVISKTWAVHRANARSYAEGIAGLVEAVGRDFITEAAVPPWASLSAHQSGLPLPETARLHTQLRTRLATGAAPSTILQWANLLVELLKGLPPRQLQRILPKEPYGSSRLAGIYELGHAECEAGWAAYQRALEAWMQGKPLISVATEVHTRPVNNSPGRGAQDPLPRVITIANKGFQFGLSLVAGAVVAIVANEAEHEPDRGWNLSEESLRTLNLLPLAIRYGADTPEALAWMRAGVRTRVAAHMLNRIQPPPEGLTDEALQRWAFGRLRELAEGAILGVTTPEQDRIVKALETVRQAG